MPTVSTTTSVSEDIPVAYLVGTERSVQMIRPGTAPKINYDMRQPREVVKRLSDNARRNKIRSFGTLDMTPMRHSDFAYATLHFPTVNCFTVYAVTPDMVKAAWKKMNDRLSTNILNPITGKKTFFWNLEYQRTHCPHFSMGLVIPVSMEHKMIAQWRNAVGHPISMDSHDVIYFERRDPENASPEAAATYMSKPKGHQEISPTEWSDQGWNPPRYWGVVGMEHLPQAVTPVYGEANIRGVNREMRQLSETKVIDFVNPKTGRKQKHFKTSWNEFSPKGSSEIRNRGDGLLLLDHLIELFGGDPDLN